MPQAFVLYIDLLQVEILKTRIVFGVALKVG